MIKWFDTNYHYLLPEFTPGQRFALCSTKAVDEFAEAKAQGIVTRPVLLGPITYLKLGKSKADGFAPRDLLPVYHYPAEIGPGVYDIHSQRVPAVAEMTLLLGAASRRLPADKLWVNPYCGLKTRKWSKVRLAIENMVIAAKAARAAA